MWLSVNGFTLDWGCDCSTVAYRDGGFAGSETADFVKSGKLANGYYKQKFNYMNLHGDVMFNLNALFGGYNSHRVYEIIPLFGSRFYSFIFETSS